MFSPSVKDQFFEHFPNLVMTDAIGSSESGTNGIIVVAKGKTAMKGGPTVTPVRDTVVLDEDLRPVEPGSGVDRHGRPRRQHPARLLQGPGEDGRDVRRPVDGTRYVIPGDFATVEADGTITLLGRGSVSINSGGEKIFPEEVEAAVKSHPDVYDAVVVGVPDERWGQRVAAVVQAARGRDARRSTRVQDALPRPRSPATRCPASCTSSTQVQRSPSGKPDYRWAKKVATGES